MYIPDLPQSYGSFILQHAAAVVGFEQTTYTFAEDAGNVECVQDFSNLTKMILV